VELNIHLNLVPELRMLSLVLILTKGRFEEYHLLGYDVVSTYVSEKYIAFIFRVEETGSAKPEAGDTQNLAICSSEASVETKRTTRGHIPEYDTLHNHRCENLKSYKGRFVFAKEANYISINTDLQSSKFPPLTQMPSKST
jgi:hypothetical protein